MYKISKNSIKNILITVLFVGAFFPMVSKAAVECCYTKKIDNLTEESCRVKGTSLCGVVGMLPCVGGSAETVYNPITQKAEIRCLYGATTMVSEEKISCTANLTCITAAAKEFSDCSSYNNIQDCNTINPSACWFSEQRNQCISRADSDLCASLTKVDCDEMKIGSDQICEWKADTSGSGGNCQNKLQQAMGAKYDKSDEARGPFLPSCAIDGSCRSINDIFGVVLKLTEGLFKYIGALAFAFFVYGGFTMILAFGNQERFKKGQHILLAAVAGLIIAFSAYLIVSFVLEAMNVTSDFRIIK